MFSGVSREEASQVKPEWPDYRISLPAEEIEEKVVRHVDAEALGVRDHKLIGVDAVAAQVLD